MIPSALRSVQSSSFTCHHATHATTLDLQIKHRKPDSSSQSGWLANIAGPRFTETDDFFDHRKSSLDSLEAQLKTLHSSLSAASKTRRSYSQSLSELSQALLTLSTCDLSKPIRNALDRLAGLHRQCHAWSEEQSKQELEGLTATVEAYSRLINSVRLTFTSRIKTWEKWQVSLNNLRKVQVNHDKAKRYSTNEHSTGLMYSLSELVEVGKLVLQGDCTCGFLAFLCRISDDYLFACCRLNEKHKMRATSLETCRS